MEEKKDYKKEFTELMYALLGINMSNTVKVVDNYSKILFLETIVSEVHRQISMVIYIATLNDTFELFVGDLSKYKGITFSYKELILLCSNAKTDILTTYLWVMKSNEQNEAKNIVNKIMEKNKRKNGY